MNIFLNNKVIDDQLILLEKYKNKSFMIHLDENKWYNISQNPNITIQYLIDNFEFIHDKFYFSEISRCVNITLHDLMKVDITVKGSSGETFLRKFCYLTYLNENPNVFQNFKSIDEIIKFIKGCSFLVLYIREQLPPEDFLTLEDTLFESLVTNEHCPPSFFNKEVEEKCVKMGLINQLVNNININLPFSFFNAYLNKFVNNIMIYKLIFLKDFKIVYLDELFEVCSTLYDNSLVWEHVSKIVTFEEIQQFPKYLKKWNINRLVYNPNFKLEWIDYFYTHAHIYYNEWDWYGICCSKYIKKDDIINLINSKQFETQNTKNVENNLNIGKLQKPSIYIHIDAVLQCNKNLTINDVLEIYTLLLKYTKYNDNNNFNKHTNIYNFKKKYLQFILNKDYLSQNPNLTIDDIISLDEKEFIPLKWWDWNKVCENINLLKPNSLERLITHGKLKEFTLPRFEYIVLNNSLSFVDVCKKIVKFTNDVSGKKNICNLMVINNFERRNEYRDFKKRESASRKIQKAWVKWWFEPNENDVSRVALKYLKEFNDGLSTLKK